ncbi:hypothetical protein J2R96_005845 [Bradyrhizobium elkanii]|nr:hypothetical protein [Bradyrhizobium elkanii]
MSKKTQTIPANHTHDAQKLADLAALLGLMQAAGKLSQELEALATQVGGSLEKIAERFGVPFFEVHQAYVEEAQAPKKPTRTAKRPSTKTR